jgi:hypothetical protein
VPLDTSAPSVSSAPNPYSELPAVGPYDVAIGSALITLVEPHVGHEQTYNRWYEDDHFYAGCMAMPWMFSGRRWVATRELRDLREPAKSAVMDPVDLGIYIATYWLTEGRYEDHMRWTVGTNKRLLADGRVYLERDHIFTAFQEYLGVSYRDEAGPRDIHALEYPYSGLVVEVIDAAEGHTAQDVLTWLREVRAPQVMAAAPVVMGLYFTPLPLPEDRMSYVKQVEGLGRRVTVLWFTEVPAVDAWDAAFRGAGVVGSPRSAPEGLGRTELVAPFLPTLPGSEMYIDQLR